MDEHTRMEEAQQRGLLLAAQIEACVQREDAGKADEPQEHLDPPCNCGREMEAQQEEMQRGAGDGSGGDGGKVEKAHEGGATRKGPKRTLEPEAPHPREPSKKTAKQSARTAELIAQLPKVYSANQQEIIAAIGLDQFEMLKEGFKVHIVYNHQAAAFRAAQASTYMKGTCVSIARKGGDRVAAIQACFAAIKRVLWEEDMRSKKSDHQEIIDAIGLDQFERLEEMFKARIYYDRHRGAFHAVNSTHMKGTWASIASKGGDRGAAIQALSLIHI